MMQKKNKSLKKNVIFVTKWQNTNKNGRFVMTKVMTKQ